MLETVSLSLKLWLVIEKQTSRGFIKHAPQRKRAGSARIARTHEGIHPTSCWGWECRESQVWGDLKGQKIPGK